MGFLLQARSAGAKRRRYGRGAGIRSRRLGLLLAGGSWILTPPGTHTLRCLSDGDTITHSDKQLKRNLSFVWKAPDQPKGDVRFHITVVQSYFIYWAGVESAVVHDGSRSVWSGVRTTPLDGTSTVSSSHQDNVTVLPALEADSPDEQPNRTTAQKQPIITNRRPQTLETGVGSTAWRLNNSVTLTHHAGNTTNALESIQNETSTTPDSFSKVPVTTPDPVPHAKTRSSIPSTSFMSSADDREMDTTTTVQPSTGLHSPSDSIVPFFPQIGIGTQMEDPRIKSQEPILDTNQEIKDTTLILKNTQFETQGRSEEPDRNVLPQSHTSTVKSETPSSSQIYSSKHQVQTSTSKPGVLFQTRTGHITFPSKTSPTKTKISPPMTKTPSPKPVPPSTSPPDSFYVTNISKPDLLSLKPARPLGTSPSGPKSTLKQTSWSQTTMSPGSSSQPRSVSSFHQSLTRTTPSQTQTEPSHPQRDRSQSEIPAESQSLFQTERTSSAHPVKPLLPTLRSDPIFTLETDPKPQAEIRGRTSVFGFGTSVTSSPTVTTSDLLHSESLHVSSVLYPSETDPLQTSEDSSMHSSFSSTSSTHSSSSFTKNQVRTNPALSALPSPSLISTPPHLPSAHLTPTALPSTPTSSTIQSSNHPSDSSILSSGPVSPSPFNSSQCLTCSVSSPSTSTVSTSTFSSPSNPTSSASPLSVSSRSFPSTSASTPSPLGRSSSSSFMSSITTPHPGPFSSPRHFLQTSKTPTDGQKLVFHLTSSNPEPNLSSATQRTRVHPNPKPFPNHRSNHGQEIKPGVPTIDVKPKKPPVPPVSPDEKGKYPDIIPRHSAWELGMLLGCSAGLGVLLVVGVRYVYRQACGRRTEVTLNDREREYERGGRGLIQVQECGDLVRVRKIRENSFVLLTEYDVLAPPGD